MTRRTTASGCGLMPDEHGASLPTDSALLAAVADLRRQTPAGSVVVLAAVSLSNAAQIAEALGAAALEEVTAAVARTTLMRSGRPARLLKASPLGGFLLALVADESVARTQVEQALAEARRLVTVSGRRIWPVLSVGAAACRPHEPTLETVALARAAVVDAGRRLPGHTVWAGAPAVDLELVSDLAAAVTEDPSQLALHYQSVFGMRIGCSVAAEALLRWHHPRRGVVDAAQAARAAEQSGLAVPLGRWVMREALRQRARWGGSLGPMFRVHVNVSPLELRDPTYVDAVAHALHDAGVAPAELLLEITETSLLSEEAEVTRTIAELDELGVGIGIDDFGTGFSAISHLHRLPIDTVKLDRSLTAGVAREPGDFAFLRQVFGLVSSLDVMVVAEGVQSALEASHLRSMGFAFGQGYHFGRPAPAAEFHRRPTRRSATA